MKPFANGIPVILGPDGRPLRSNSEGRVADGSPEAAGMRFPLPHSWTFVARQGGAYNTYWHGRYDEALRHAREDAEVMRRDAYLMALLKERQLAVSGLPWHIEVPDENDHRQVLVRDGLTRIVKSIPCLRRIFMWLLEAIWYGRYGVEVVWKWDRFVWEPVQVPKDNPMAGGMPGMPGMPGQQPGGGNKDEIDKMKRGKSGRCLTVDWALPVNGDKIGYQHDHTPYILVSSDRATKLAPHDLIFSTSGAAITLRGTWRERFIIHKQDQIDADYFNPEQADSIHGVGARSAVFWLNWLKLEWMSNITDFFDRVGLGFTMWKYPAGNDQARDDAEAAALAQQGRAHVLVPVWGEAGREALTGVERVEVPTSGASELRSLVEYLDKQIERYMVGQEGSSRSAPSGLGNDSASNFMQDTKRGITKYDAHLLAETVTGSAREPGLLSVIKKNTFPWADFPAWLVFDIEDVQSSQKLQAARTLIDSGLKIKEDEARAAGGFSKPAENDAVVQSPNPAGGLPGMPPGPTQGGMPGAPGMGMPGEGGEGEGGAEGGQEGDFLDALRSSSDEHEEPERYNWANQGIVRLSPSGLPLYRWYDSMTRQARIQNVRPGHGRHGRKFKRGAGPGRTRSAELDVDPETLNILKQALQVMFPDGWVKPSSLTTLIAAPPSVKVRAGVRREEDGTLKVGLRHKEADGPFVLKLRPNGELVASCPSADDMADAAVGLGTAGFDRVRGGDEDFDYKSIPDGVPAAVRKANDKRRHHRRDHADELMSAADEFLPRPSGGYLHKDGQVIDSGADAYQRQDRNTKYRFSSTQFDLPSELADEIKKMATGIADEDLAEDGREETPHLTIKYGLHADAPDEVKKAAEKFGPVTIRLGKVSVFPADKEKDQDYDVVKIGVESDELRRLNAELSKLDHSDKHPDYNPHITLAYVKPGYGKMYEGRDDFDGRELTLSTLLFCDKNGTKTEVPLGDEVAIRHARLLDTVRYLRSRGQPELATSVALAYARRGKEQER